MGCPAVDISRSHVVRVRTDIHWLPEKFRHRRKRIRIRFRTVAGERRLFRKRKRIPPSQWAPKNRRITYGPLKGSYYDPDFMPHMNGIVDALVFPSVRELGNCKAPQTGSSAGAETALGYLADMDPGDALIVYPDRDTSSKRGKDYLQPMFKESPRLRKLLTGVADDMAALRVKLQTMLIYMGWAHSVTSLGNVSVKYLFLDEVDKYPEQASKKEASTISLAKERVRAYRYGSKIWYNSTPTDSSGPITRFMESADVVFDFHPKCPDCGRHQRMVFENIKFPADQRDPDVIERQGLAVYVCGSCGVEWDDRKRDRALVPGKWFARDDGREMQEYLLAMRPKKVCFHSPSWISTLVSLSEVAAAFLRGTRSKLAMRYFVNQHKAEAFLDYEVQRKEDAILALRDDRPEGLVPAGNVISGLVAGGDTQDDRLYYHIHAFGWGLEQESWQIKSGVVHSWEALKEVVFGFEYRDADGIVYPVQLLVQDAMGHRTSDVYDFARSMPGRVVPYKGASGRRPRPYIWTKVDRYPGTDRPIPGGLKLLTVDTHHYKDQLASRLATNPDDPGALHLHSEATEEFAAHLCVEYVDERQLWQQPKGRRQDYWDAMVLSFVAADLLQLRFRKKTAPAKVEKKKEVPVNPYTGGRQLFGGASVR